MSYFQNKNLNQQIKILKYQKIKLINILKKHYNGSI